jgi:hypothetical protein
MATYVNINSRASKGIVYIFLVVLLALIMTGILIMKNTLQFDETGQILLNIMLAMIAVQFVILFYNGFMKKIQVLPEGIQFQSPFTAYTLLWTDIRSIGAYRSMKNVSVPLPFEELDQTIIFGSAWIYFSVLPREQVLFRNKKNTTIIFPYQKAILREIQQYFDFQKLVR